MTHTHRLVAVCRRLASLGLSPGGSGNVSVRIGDQVFVTPTGSALSRVDESELAVVDIEGQVLCANCPSKEYPLHLAAYRARPDARAIVHLHSDHAVAVSCLEDRPAKPALPTLTPYQVTRLGELPVADYAQPGSDELATSVGDLMSDHHAVLLAQHGSVVAASDLDLASDLAEELESTARLALLLRGLPYRELPHDAVAALRA